MRSSIIHITRLLLAIFAFTTYSAHASEGSELKHVDWKFNGYRGTFDRAAVQRGFQVYKEVCAACHSIKRIAFRDLSDLGFSDDEVKAIAASYMIQDGPNENGDMFQRPGRPSDHFPLVFANDEAARAANNGALPPDLSLIVKARAGGPDYIYSLLTGFENPPEGMKIGENMYYNPYFTTGAGRIAMTPPLHTTGQVAYIDGTQATVEQMSKDVVNFLQWAAEPEMERRKGLGIKVLIFMLVFTVLFYFAKRRIWKRVK